MIKTTDLAYVLYAKANKEFDDLELELLGESKEAIIDRASEITDKTYILSFFESGMLLDAEQIMELLKEMNEKTGTAVLLISHDLGVVRNMCSRIYVMYAGHIVESGMTDEVFEHPLHPYTQGLIQSVPDATKREKPLVSILGTVPALAERRQQGCPFFDRCEKQQEICGSQACKIYEKDGHLIACHLYAGQDSKES